MADHSKVEKREWFLSLIKSMGYTQSAFAEESDISRVTLEKLISGNTMPSAAVSKKVEAILGVPGAWWENPPENPLEELLPTNHYVTSIRHINSIGEVALPAAFRRALGWDFGMNVLVKLDMPNKRLIIEKSEKQ